MTWTKLTDTFVEAAWDLSDAAFRLHVSALVYSNQMLTDGLIPRGRVSRLAPRQRRAAVSELLAAGWWQEDEVGYHIVDFHVDQPSRGEVEARRAADRNRKQRERARPVGGTGQPVSRRDHDRDTDGDGGGDGGPYADLDDPPVSRPSRPGPPARSRPGPLRPAVSGDPTHTTSATASASGWEGWASPWLVSFASAWQERFRRPPTDRQREALWPVVDAWPTKAGEWVRAAPKASTFEIVAFVLQRFREACRASATQVGVQAGARESRSGSLRDSR